MFKNITRLLIVLILLSLISCGSDTEKVDEKEKTAEITDKTNNSKLRNYPGKDFSMGIPKTWNIITKDKDVVPSPRNGQIELAVTSTQTKGGFSNNLMILSQNLEKYTTSKRYSIINNVGAKNEYINYYEIEDKDFTFKDGEKSKLYIFKAKYSASTPILTYLQTAYICNNNKAFFLTIAIPTTIKNTKRYEDMLSTFKCK